MITVRLRRAILAGALFAAALAPSLASADGLPPSLASEFSLGQDSEVAYVLDTTSGAILFGDGVVGRTPGTGAVLWSSYASGTGAAGNVPAEESFLSSTDIVCLVLGC